MLLEIKELKNELQKAMTAHRVACPSAVKELLRMLEEENGKHSAERQTSSVSSPQPNRS